MLRRETTNTNYIVFGLTRQRFELVIYRTVGEHANHYTIDVVLELDIIVIDFTSAYTFLSCTTASIDSKWGRGGDERD